MIPIEDANEANETEEGEKRTAQPAPDERKQEPELEQEPEEHLARTNRGSLASTDKALTVNDLERALLKRFPAADAEDWDRTGLLAGDPAKLVTGVMCALDPTVSAVRAAERSHANVLLTHHPAFIDAPRTFTASQVRSKAGAVVWEAASRGVALMNFHTALDVSSEGVRVLPRLLSLDFESVLVQAGTGAGKGYGAFCRVREGDDPFTVGRLAARCTAVLGRAPRVWGDFDRELETVVCANGSASGVVDAAVRADAGCLVCGEIKYHDALAASEAGLAIIEVGHDSSELPLAALLAAEVRKLGLPADRVMVLDQSSNWSYPDSTRL